MSDVRKSTSADDPESKLRRRTEKQWRHEDRDLAATTTFNNIVLAVQASFIPLSSVALGDKPDACGKAMFVIIVIASLASIIGVAISVYLLSEFERFSGWYYRITGSGDEYPAGFDEKHEESNRKAKWDKYDKCRPVILWLHTVSFALSSMLFCAIILTRG